MLAVLRRRNFALLWSGGLISEMGDWLLMIGLPIYVYLLTGSALQTSALFIVEFLPTIILGSVAGVLVDRWDRRRILVIGNGLQGIILLSLLPVRSPSDLWIIYVVALTEAIISQFIGPAANALLPTLVDEEQIVAANALVAVNTNVARLVGSPLGGFVVGVWSLGGVVLLDAVSFFLAMMLITIVSMPSKVESSRGEGAGMHLWHALWLDWIGGLVLIRRSRTLLTIFCVAGLQFAAQGIFLVLYVIWTLTVLHGGATGVGWLRGVQAIGALLGGLLVGSLGGRVRATLLLGFGLVAFGVVEFAIWNSPALFPGLALPTILFIAVGLPGAAYGAALSTILQTSTTDQYRGRVFGAFMAACSLFQVVAMSLAGFFGDRIGVLRVLDAQAALYVLIGVLALVSLPARLDVATESAAFGQVPDSKG